MWLRVLGVVARGLLIGLWVYQIINICAILTVWLDQSNAEYEPMVVFQMKL